MSSTIAVPLFADARNRNHSRPSGTRSWFCLSPAAVSLAGYYEHGLPSANQSGDGVGRA